MARMRIACLVIAQFSIDVALRKRPALAGRPLAIAEGASRRTIASASADATGVQIGMTPKQARAACPGLVIVGRDEAAELAATQELLEALETCSPLVEGTAPGVCCFAASNLPGGENAALGAAMALASALGFSCVAATVADDKFTARCAALVARRGASIVPPGRSAAFLAPLPIVLLPLAPGDADRFDLLGLRTIGQIAALPAGPLAARFGERSRHYARLARGEDDAPLTPRHTPTVHESRFAFDGPIDQSEALLFALRGCVTDVASRLAGSAQACDRVEIVLTGSDRAASATPAISVMLAEPTASAETIFALCRITLDAREKLGSVEALVVRATPCGQPPPQLALFDGSRASRRAAVAATLARLRAGLERERIVTMQPTPARSRLPERMQQPAPIESPRDLAIDSAAASMYGRASLGENAWAPAMRLVDPPSPIDPPASNAACAGPFRLSEQWWERPVERDYYQMVDPSGSLVLVFRDARDDCWYLQGVFD